MYCVRNTVVPNIATPTATDAATASTTVRSRKRPIGISGSVARRSTTTAANRMTTPPSTMAAVCQPSQAKSFPASETQMRSDETPAAVRVPPRTSMWTSPRLFVGRCRVRRSSTSATSANGTPTKKHQRQPRPSVSGRE